MVCGLSGPRVGDGPVSGDGSAIPAPDNLRHVVLREIARAGSAGWMARSACQGTDPELFFLVALMGRAVEQISSAKAVCARCEVGRNCLSYAMETMPHGIWGGTTREERMAMRVPPAMRVQVQVDGPCT